MCGLHFVINKEDSIISSNNKFVENGFVAGSLRGMDSSGLFQIDKKGKAMLHKAALGGSDFISTKHAQRLINEADGSIATICHTRAATMGKINSDSAHPFATRARKDGTFIIGVHNGTLQNWQSKKNGRDYTVDSEWAFNHILENGVDAFSDFQGAFAMIWWDSAHKEKIFIARNKERELHFMRTANKKRMYGGSEAGMVDWLCTRNNISVEDTVFSIEEDKLYTLDLSGKEIEYKKSHLPKWVYQSSYTGPSVTYGGNGNTTPTYGGAAGSPESRRSNYTDSNPYSTGQDERDWGDEGFVWNEDTQSWSYDSAAAARRETSTTPGIRRTGTSELSTEAVRVLKEAKLALAAARNARFQKITQEQLSKDTQAAADKLPVLIPLKKSEDNDEVSLSDLDSCPDTWYSKSSALSTEIAAAKSMGVLGELTWFSGQLVEPETSECLGDVELYESGVGKIKYTGVIRNISSTAADRRLINNNTKGGRNGDWAVIIGVTNEFPGRDDAKMFVLTELTAEGKKALHSKRS